jgi:hypothetical protein
MKTLLVLLFVPFMVIPAFAESQTLPTEQGTLDVKLTYDTINQDILNKIGIGFINPQTQKIQIHIDYVVTVSKNNEIMFGPTQLIHTSEGAVKIPIEFNLGEGTYSMNIEVQGILFNPIPPETVSFDISVGEAFAQPDPENETPENVSNGGGCLIATAAFGSELAPQVQQLRELRDNTILQTESGTAFMAGFNQFYYSFSPVIADLERESPIFKEIVKLTLTPMISTLSIMALAEDNNESQVLGLGISVIVLNLGMYITVPAIAGFAISKRIKSRN